MSHSKNTPEGFVFITNISDPPNEDTGMDFESEAMMFDRLQRELGDDLVITEPAYDKDGRPWAGLALHVREGVTFTLLKSTSGKADIGANQKA